MKRIVPFLCAALFPFFTYAWNPAGHETAGAIAYYYLKDHNPDVLEKVLATLRLHPWYADRWNDSMKGMSEEEKNITLFMLASTFPDDARKIAGLGDGEKTKWHYVDYPLVPPGDPTKGLQPETPNAEEKIIELLSMMKNQEETSEKAISLCWLFHLVEDIHQPLHTVSLFDVNHPTGDRGGNETFFLLNGNTTPVKLHYFWDGLLQGTLHTCPAQAKELLDRRKFRRRKLFELKLDKTVNTWVKESVNLAVTEVYVNYTITGTKENPTPAPADYAENAKQIAERRIVLSGIRLADVLVQIYS